MEAKVYNQQGKESGTVALPESIFALPWNADLVHQVITSMLSSARSPIAHTKDRGDVSGGGKKPWKQKGTGRARHGSIRSPLWRGGGITFGPSNEKNYDRKVNKKMKAKALYTILSRKYKDGEVLFVETLSLNTPKTKDAKVILETMSTISGFEKLATKKNNAAYVALGAKNKPIEKSFSNFGNIHVDEVRNMNPVHIAQYKYLIITDPKNSLSFIEGKLPVKK